jgi:hypothetical protein
VVGWWCSWCSCWRCHRHNWARRRSNAQYDGGGSDGGGFNVNVVVVVVIVVVIVDASIRIRRASRHGSIEARLNQRQQCS